jgi:hypothetical protein
LEGTGAKRTAVDDVLLVANQHNCARNVTSGDFPFNNSGNWSEIDWL